MQILAPDATLTPVAWSPDGSQILVLRANTNLDSDLLLVPLPLATLPPLSLWGV